jgi:cytochrome c-type biogenesis protein CcmH
VSGFIAGVLVGVAAGVLAAPLWRRARARVTSRPLYLSAGAFVMAFAAAAALIYFAIDSRHSLESHAPQLSASAPGGATQRAAASSMDAAIASLETRLARSGGSDADWTLLAQAYEFQGRAEDARRARAHLASPPAGTVTQMSAAALVAAATAAGTSGGNAEPAVAPSTSLAELQQRVQQDPRDVQGWLALADLRRTQHDNSGARAALDTVIGLRGMTAQSWADYADVLASLTGGSLGGAAGKAIDNALALDPNNLKALWLKASQAHEQRRYAEALGWWKKLRAVLPPDSADARVIDSNIAEDSQLAGLPSPSRAGAASTNPEAVATLTAPVPPAAAGGVQVSGTVSVDDSLAARVPPDATLFIYAKAADSPGAPLAVVRTTASGWPVSFHLDDSMAMIPSRRLSQFDRVLIEARISRSGQATPSSGDLYVTSRVLRPMDGQKLTLVIDRKIP